MPGSQTPSTRRTAAALLAALTLSLALTLLGAGTALAQEVVYGDTERKDLTDPGVTYVIRGDGPGDSHVKCKPLHLTWNGQLGQMGSRAGFAQLERYRAYT